MKTLLLCSLTAVTLGGGVAPINDEPAGATTLTVGANFAEFSDIGTNVDATASEVADPSIPSPGCGSYGGGDVWFSAMVPATGNITFETKPAPGSSITDTGIAVYSGPIGGFVLVECDDDDGDGFFSLISLTGQTPGATLWLRVFEFGNNAFGEFTVSAWDGGPPSLPANDEPTGAPVLDIGLVFDDESVVSNNFNATASEVADPTIPAPGCANYQGGDVWFSAIVPASGAITLETRIDSGSSFFDGGMAVYDGPIGAFVLVECDDDDGLGLFSKIELTGRTPGEMLHIRVWEYGGNVEGTFQVSAYSYIEPTTFGVGCGDPSTPVISASGFSVVGEQFSVELTNAPIVSVCALFIGASNTTWDGVSLPLDLSSLGFNACFMNVAPNAIVPSATNVNGEANATFTIPNTGLLGTTFYWQWLVATPGSGNPLHVTEGLETLIQ